MGFLGNFNIWLGNFGVVGITAIFALAVSFKHETSPTIDYSMTDKMYSCQPTWSCSFYTTCTCTRYRNIQVRAWLLPPAYGIVITAPKEL